MTGAILNLLVNVIIAVLLIVTIGYCWILNRRIRVLQDSKGELAQLLNHFDKSTQRASESIVALQVASKKIGESIQQRAEKAHFLLDDLSFMIEKAETLTNKMEADIAISRAHKRVGGDAPRQAEVPRQPEPPTPPQPRFQPVNLSAQEDAAWSAGVADEVMTKKAPASRERTVAALEAVLERAKRRSQEAPVVTEPVRKIVPQTTRSKSEKELLEMIRSGFSG